MALSSEGFDMAFTHRGSWKTNISRLGKVAETVDEELDRRSDEQCLHLGDRGFLGTSRQADAGILTRTSIRRATSDLRPADGTRLGAATLRWVVPDLRT